MHEDSIERVCIAATTSTNTREEKADTVEGVYVIYKAQKRYMRKVAKLFNVLL